MRLEPALYGTDSDDVTMEGQRMPLRVAGSGFCASPTSVVTASHVLTWDKHVQVNLSCSVMPYDSDEFG